MGRIAKWGTVLGAFDIKYMPCTSVKSQVLAELVAKFTEPPLEETSTTQNMDGKSVGTIFLQEPLFWKVYIDDAANQRRSGVGLVLISPEKLTIEKSLRLGFSAMNNEAEHEALLEGMSMVQRMGEKAVKMFLDSRLVVGQVKGELEVRDERMQGYLSQVRHLQSGFESFTLLYVPRSGNIHADSLAMLATSLAQSLPRVILIEDLCKPTEIKGQAVHVHQIRIGPSWMDSIVPYLREDILPKDKSKAEKIRRKASRFWLSEDQKLYKRSFFGPYLLCVHPKVTELLLEELYEGICGSHIGGRSLSHRAITQDIVGHFPKAARNKKYLLVDTNYFTKWVETEPLANIRDVDAKKRYCCELGITNIYSTSAYPQGNGQAEPVNKVIVSGFKKRLDDAKGKWVEELSHVLWMYRTTPRRSTGETPFSMTYGAKAVIPLETGFPTLKTNFNPSSNN
ncbi:uncharacterized protein LOC126703891 [Quercus robur]|uniref:uncharacterized protein LOC126703891 n=1 Tax=Quercus robur TaxID=38942 RepID=UPI002163ACFA|nr:uncharacterized protein LOC126703891 [Quercus robur]